MNKKICSLIDRQLKYLGGPVRNANNFGISVTYISKKFVKRTNC